MAGESYPYIRAYGRYMGSNDSFIQDEVARAHADKAPGDAWAWSWSDPDHSGRVWMTMAELETKAAKNHTAAQTLRMIRQHAGQGE